MSLPHAALMVALLMLVLATASWADLPGDQHWRNALKPRGEPGPELTLAKDGQTDYVIVIPEQETGAELKAAQELSHWLNAMTGAEYAVVEDSNPAQDHEICVGNTSRGAGIPSFAGWDLKQEGYSLSVDAAKLFLRGGSGRGPINAVFAFLEEDLGCRWYTKSATRVLHRPTLKVRPVPRVFVPKLTIRDPFYHDAFNGEWSLRNRTNAPSAPVPEEWGGHVQYARFVHTYNELVPPGKYFKDHPEMFMQNADGTRTARQVCHTNEDTIRVATETALAILKDRPKGVVISVSKNDGGGSCVCEKCLAIDKAEGSDAGSLLHFVNAVAEGIEKERPDVTVSTLAYLETYLPPKTIRPRHNVAIRLCTDRCMWSRPFRPARESEVFQPALEGWAKIHNRIHIWDYVVNFSHYCAPMPNMHAVADNIRNFVEHNCTGVMLQGAYQSPGGERELMRCWVYAKQLWDPSLDTDALMHDFVYGYYGKAAPAVADYYNLLQETARVHEESMKAPQGGIRYDMRSPFLSDGFLTRANELFDEAEALAENEDILHRVELERLPIIYVQIMRGPAETGAAYPALVDRFETITKRVGMTHIAEGPPDVESKIKTWRAEVGILEQVASIGKDDWKNWELSNEWKFAKDPEEKGVAGNWFAADLDDADWATVRSDTGNGWESQGFADYTGWGWYRQTFTAPESMRAGKVKLFFEAVDEDAIVYLNGEKVFEHTVATTGLQPESIWVTPFVVDVTDKLKFGEPNQLTVAVLNRMGMGGVYKPVRLVSAERQLDAEIIVRLLNAAEE